MSIKFSKYHGCGNDFICIDYRDQTFDLKTFAVKWCRRGFGVGADGVLALEESSLADFKMTVVNADGSIPEMCGNGLRCFVAFLIHQNWSNKSQLSIETDAGVLNVSILNDAYPTSQISVEMGAVHFQTTLSKEQFSFDPTDLTQSLTIDGQHYSFVPIEVGNPHCVLFLDHIDSLDLTLIGPKIECHPFFPQQVNVEFVEIISRQDIKLRVWERGVGETNACGTGACASVAAGVLLDRLDQQCGVSLLGGQLAISYDKQSHHIVKNGPAKFIFESTLID